MSQNKKNKRLLALDIFRGLTIIAMIIVNSPNTYGELSHAYWVGINFADFVFPFFVLISGVAVCLGFKNIDPSTTDMKPVINKVLRRTALLFGLGLIVNLFYTHFEQVRILGVLQRIALVYCACCFLAIYCSTRTIIKIGVGILVAYWVFVMLIPAPGLPAGHLERGKNIVNWFDQFMPGMLWRGEWDPEGLLSTFPSIVTGIMGMLIAKILIKNAEQLNHAVMNLFVFGFLAFCIGCVWSLAFPFIKQIWSSSFVLATGGIGAMILAVMIWYTDIKGYRWGIKLPVIFGANAISAYVLHVIIEKFLDWEFFGSSVHQAYVDWSFHIGMNEFMSALIWVALFFGVCCIPVIWMYKKHIFIKI